MGEYTNIIQGMFGDARLSAVGDSEEDPEKAARAIQLGKAIGMAPEVVHGDLDRFDQDYKRTLTGQLIESDGHLAEYVNSSPMAAKVSNDDWAPLAKISESLRRSPKPFTLPLTLGSDAAVKAFPDMLDVFKEALHGITSAPEKFLGLVPPEDVAHGQQIEQWMLAQGQSQERATFESSLLLRREQRSEAMQGALFGPPMMMAAPAIGAFRTFVAKPIEELTGFPKDAVEQYAMVLMAGLGIKHLRSMGDAAKLKEVVDAAEPYLRAGKEPPLGVHPTIDEGIKARSAEELKHLNDLFSEAQKSATRERAPELFEQFLEMRDSGLVGINAEVIAELYKNKPPGPEDGLLGWVPNLESQMGVALANGGDIIIPRAMLLARMEPEVFRELQDFIRPREGGITKAEGEVLEKAKATKEETQAAKEELEFEQQREKSINSTITRDKAQLAIAKLEGNPTLARNIQERINSSEEKLAKTQEKIASLEKPAEGEIAGKTVAAKPLEETIKSAAILLKDGRVIEGITHADAMETAKVGSEDVARSDLFSTSTGRVVDRKEGARIAEAASQVSSERITPELGLTAEGLESSPFPKTEVRGPSLLEQLVPVPPEVKSVRAAASLPLDYGTGPKKGWNWGAPQEPARIRYGGNIVELQPSASTTLRQALSEKELGELEPFKGKLKPIIDRIMEVAGDIPVHLITNEQYRKVSGGAPGGEKGWAFYSEAWKGTADHIVLSSDAFYSPELPRTILHEAVHGATTKLLHSDKGFAGAIRSVMDELAKADPELVKKYGFLDEHEFLAEAISNREFQDQLAAIELSPKMAEALGMKEWIGKTLWRAVVDYIRRGLGIPEGSYSALEAALRLTEAAIESQEAKLGQTEAPATKAAKQMDLPGITRQEDLHIFQTITGFMNKKQRDFYMEKIAERNGKDAEFRAKQVEKQLRKEMTAEWKAEAKQLREQVLDELHQRPDIAAVEFFRSGKLYGEETGTRPRVDPKSLTPEQLAAFPEKYLRRDGMDGNDVAQLLGFTTVEDMGAKIKAMDETVGTGSLPSLLEKLATGETERRMRAKHGDLDENILAEAQDHVIAAPQMDMLHEELHALGMKTGSEMSFSKADFKAWAKVKINSLPADGISMEKFFRDSGKAGREYELAMLSEDWNQAFKNKQQQYLSLLLADEAKKFEKKREQLEGNLKRYRKAQVPGIAPEHLNYVHDIMQRIGAPVERSVGHVAEGIAAHGFGTLEEFYKYRNQIGLPEEFKEYNVDYTPSMPVADFLFDPAFQKKLEAMSVGEVTGVADTLKALIKNGREEAKFIRAGEAFDLAQLKEDMITQLRGLGEKPLYKPEQASALGKVKHFVSRGFAGLLQMEALWDRFDHGDPRGIFTRNIAHPFADAGSYYSTLQRQFSKMLTEIQRMDKSLKEGVPSGPIIDPHTVDFEPRPRVMNRENLRTVILNMGTNFEKMARGHGVDPIQLHNWVMQHATKEDWEYAKGMWNLFSEIKKLEDEMTHSLSGVTIEDLPGRTIQTPFGEFEAGYFPMRYDRTVGAGPKVDIENELAFFRPMTSHGWEKKRTGYAGPIDLTLGSVPQEILRRLKDLAFRPVIIEASKIMLDKQFKSAVTRYQGGPYADLMLPYLKDMAGQAGITAANMQAIERIGEGIRQNSIGVLVGWNPGTVIKHGLSAWSNSMAEVGVGSFLEWFGKTWADPSMKNYKFVMQGGKIGNLEWTGSAEVQRRMQHFEETLGGAHDIIMGKPTIRQKALQWGSRPVAISDMASTIPTWLAQYDATMRENLGKGMAVEHAHTDAVTLADRAVRNAHGSTAITSRPEFMRGSTLSKGVTSLYGFFNHVFNRYYQMAWRSKEMLEKAGRGDPIKSDVADLSNRFLLYMVGPILAEGVAELGLKKDESWPAWLWHSGIHTASGTIPILRDIVHAALGGRDPSTGIWGSGMKALTDFVRDSHKKKSDPGATIQHGITLSGIATGVGSAQIGKWARFMYDYTQRVTRPRTGEDFYRAFRRGRIERYK